MATNHYDILSVSPDAPPEVIAAAYKALSRLHHPDLNRNSAESTRRMAQINASYTVLANLASRSHYDYVLKNQRRPVAQPMPSVRPASAAPRPQAAKPYRPATSSPPDYRLDVDRVIMMCWLAFAFIVYDGYFHARPQPAHTAPTQARWLNMHGDERPLYQRLF